MAPQCPRDSLGLGCDVESGLAGRVGAISVPVSLRGKKRSKLSDGQCDDQGAKGSYRADGLKRTCPGRFSALILRREVAQRVGAIIATVSACANLDLVLCGSLEGVAVKGFPLRIRNRNTLVRRWISLDLDVVCACILVLGTVAKQDTGGLSLAKGCYESEERGSEERDGDERLGQHSVEGVSAESVSESGRGCLPHLVSSASKGSVVGLKEGGLLQDL